MTTLPPAPISSLLADDVSAVQRIRAVPKILEVVTHVTGLRFAAVARVTERDWVACAVRDEMGFGLQPGGALDVETTICNEIRQHRETVAFGHASAHPHFSTHPTPRLYGLESYISVPIVLANGALFGTLCAIDSRPSEVDAPATIKMLELFAELIGLQLQSDDESRLNQTALGDALAGAARRADALVDTSAGIHAQVQAGLYATFALRGASDINDDMRIQVGLVESSLWRISALIDGTAPAANSQRITESHIERETACDLTTALQAAFDRVRERYPGRAFVGRAAIDEDVDCDVAQVAQLVEELVSNVMRNQSAKAPVEVVARTHDGELEVTVRAPGMQVSTATLTSVSDPTSRQAQRTSNGPSWNFFIPGEIASAHGGTLRVEADAQDTFVFRMPLNV